MSKHFFHTILVLFLGISLHAGAENSEVSVVPTFNSAGIYWQPEGELSGNKGEIWFRETGEAEWREGYELYWLPREDSTSEFRGSLVRLKSNQEYDLKLVHGELQADTSFTTWNEEFKISKVVQVSPESSGFVTTEGGNENDGYVVYEPAPGSDSIIDARRLYNYGIQVNHDWVIIRGWKIRGVRNHPIHLYSKAKFIVIEYCDISGWGELRTNFATDSYGIFLDGESQIPSNIIIQYNYIHDPTYDANNWGEPNDKTSAGNHPGGTQPIWMTRCGGEIVIRYNTITGSEEHYYNDGMGEWRNFGPHGFPYRDSDINNNYISHCWDNAIEAEGGNMNVRIYENYIDSTYATMGLSNITFGPLYVFRNVTNVAHKVPGDCRETNFLKIGNKLKYDATTGKYWPCVGRAYIFNNTILQPVVNTRQNGHTGFATSTGPSNGTVYLNNIMHMSGNITSAHQILNATGDSKVNYNLYSGGFPLMTGAKDIEGVPIYSQVEEGFFLEKGSPGMDQGVEIPNFTGKFLGASPDIGAYENGSEPIKFGCGFAPVKKPGPAQLQSTSSARVSEENQLRCYPNPFSSEIIIEHPDLGDPGVEIQIFDGFGRMVDTLTNHESIQGKVRATWSPGKAELIEGLYIVRISHTNYSHISGVVYMRSGIL